MRTKALLVAGALSLAGLATSLAQSNVYSLNVVGYINLNLVQGFNMVANQLDLDGTGTNNTLTTSVGTNLPSGSRAYAFDPGSGTYKFASLVGGVWSGAAASLAAANAATQPGKGLFLSVPSASTATLVGNVLQGSLSNPIGNYYQLAASMVPQAGGIQTALGYGAVATDRVYQWLPGTQTYGAAHTYTGTVWGNGEPNLAVGEAVFLKGSATSTWNRTFTVQ